MQRSNFAEVGFPQRNRLIKRELAGSEITQLRDSGLEKPRSDPGSVSLHRARWLSILSMPCAPGSSCIGNRLRLQAHLALEETPASVVGGRLVVFEPRAPTVPLPPLLIVDRVNENQVV